MALIAYTDGSFKDGIVGSAGMLIYDGETVEDFQFFLDIPAFSVHRNVSGEIFAVMYSIFSAYKKEFKEINVHIDYEGLEKWVVGEWKARTELTKAYVEFIRHFSKSEMIVRFTKIKAHHGDVLNIYADKLSKEAAEKRVVKAALFNDFWKLFCEFI
ncbi:MAG: RNase H family protein [Fervidobacterium sp.]